LGHISSLIVSPNSSVIPSDSSENQLKKLCASWWARLDPAALSWYFFVKSYYTLTKQFTVTTIIQQGNLDKVNSTVTN
jgi:hypothetical protein